MDKMFTISITLSITNSLHPSRFSAYLLAKSKKIFAEYGYGTWRKLTTRCAALTHGYYCIGLQILLRRDTDITASGYRYYCVGIQILLRRVTDITASGYRYYCAGLQILQRRVTDITASASADVSVGLLRRLNLLTETAEFAN
jgi:hypothetical protein